MVVFVNPLSGNVADVKSGEIIKNSFNILKESFLLQNGILHFVFRLSQSSAIAFESF